MEAIKDTIQGVIGEIAKKKKFILEEWEDALKKLLTKTEFGHIRVKYFKEGVLGVDLDSSALLYQLSLRKGELLKSLGRQNCTIKDLKFRMGEMK